MCVYMLLYAGLCNAACFVQDGVYIKGMSLQGAGWDMKNSCLVEANPMQLVCPIPSIHFKPVESKRRSQKGNVSSRSVT